MEKSLIIFKPDSFEKNCIGQVLTRFEHADLRISASKVTQLNEPLLKEHYAHITHLPFFPEIMRFMQSHPVLMFIFEGTNAIDKIRILLGPTDSREAAQGTIRGDFGTDKMRNVCHASDSPVAAQAEIKRFFQSAEIYSSC